MRPSRMYEINETHDPALRSWVESANAPDSDFPIQNLPFCIFRGSSAREAFRGGVAIGDRIVDLAAVHAKGILTDRVASAAAACAAPALNDLMAMGPQAWSALRLQMSRALRVGSKFETALRTCLVPRSTAQY